MVLSFIDELNLWVKNSISAIMFTIITILVSVSLSILLRFIGSRIKKHRNKRVYTIVKLIENIIRYLIIIISIFVILDIWGFDITSAMLTVAVLCLIVGLGALDLIKDFIAGISIVMGDQYDIDEVVEINGFKGKVIEIGLRSTKLINNIGEIRSIRNGIISEITNFSRSFSVAKIIIKISNKEDVDRVIDLLEDKLPELNENYPQIVEGPLVHGIEEMNEDYFEIKITAKTNAEEHYSVRRALYKQTKKILEENNIELPYNKITVSEGNK